MDQEPSWWRPLVGGALVLPIVVVALALVAQRNDSTADGGIPRAAAGAPSRSASSTTSADPSASASPDGPSPPKVVDKRLVDFATDDTLPSGGSLLDLGKSASNLAIADGALTHGAPLAGSATGYLETKLGADVRKIGFIVNFAPGADADDGFAAITAWQSSVEKARRGGGELPKSGMRLVVHPGSWQLVVSDGGVTSLDKGTYSPADSSTSGQRFVLVRSNSQLWVLDPAGGITPVDDPRVESLAGPWVSWELSELSADAAPAAIIKVWAG